MAALFNSGAVLVLILALTGVEALGLAWLYRRSRAGIAAPDFLPNLLAGDFLLLAWLAQMHHARWVWCAAALLGALAAHVADTVRRWKGRQAIFF